MCLCCACYCSYHAKELEAGNQTSRRLQEAQLRRMQEELQLLEQQLEIEGAVRSASVSFLAAKASNLQEASVSWHSRREEDAQNKEREIEVGTGVGLSSSTALKWSTPKSIRLLSSLIQATQRTRSAGASNAVECLPAPRASVVITSVPAAIQSAAVKACD